MDYSEDNTANPLHSEMEYQQSEDEPGDPVDDDVICVDTDTTLKYLKGFYPKKKKNTIANKDNP